MDHRRWNRIDLIGLLTLERDQSAPSNSPRLGAPWKNLVRFSQHRDSFQLKNILERNALPILQI